MQCYYQCSIFGTRELNGLCLTGIFWTIPLCCQNDQLACDTDLITTVSDYLLFPTSRFYGIFVINLWKNLPCLYWWINTWESVKIYIYLYTRRTRPSLFVSFQIRKSRAIQHQVGCVLFFEHRKKRGGYKKIIGRQCL